MLRSMSAQNAASPLNEAAEMSGGSNVSNGAGRSVSVAIEIIGERVDVWSTDSTAQAPNVLGAEKYFSSMGSPC